MLRIDSLTQLLSEHPQAALQIRLPDGSFIPAHFHVTEVGRVQKDFIDCGGTVRSSTTCVLQIWVANDLQHRLHADRLSRIFELAAPILKSDDLPVEVEYERGTISQFPLTEFEVTPAGLLLQLGSKHTACLAPELCVITDDAGCCGTSNCC